MSAVGLRGTVALAERELRRVLAVWTQTLLPPVITGLLLLAVFGGALGGRLREVEGIDYSTFILPGLLVMTVAGQAFANNSTSLFQAKYEGYVEAVLMSPLRPWQMALAYMTGGLFRGFAAAFILALAAVPLAGGPAEPEIAIASLALTGLAFAALGVVTGIWAESFDHHAFVANVVVTPLALVGGVFYSAETLPEPWATLTRADPLYYLVDSTRAGFTSAAESPVGLSLAVATATAACIFALAVALLDRGWRLKP